MTCDEWKAFLQDYVTGGLSEAARAAIDRHLSDCAACFSEVRAHKLVDSHLRGQPALDVPAGLVDRVMLAALPRSRSRFRRELVRVAAVLLVAVGLGATAVVMGYQERLSPNVDQVESVRRSFETSIRGALGVTELFKR